MMLALIVILSLPLAGWVAVRMMEHIERLEMIRRGMTPPPYGVRIVYVTPLPNPVARAYLRGTIALGLGVLVLLFGLSFIAYPMAGALILMFAALALLYKKTQRRRSTSESLKTNDWV